MLKNSQAQLHIFGYLNTFAMYKLLNIQNLKAKQILMSNQKLIAV